MPIPFLSCVHTHCRFCDGKDKPELLVQKALALGFVSLGFSSHGPAVWDDYAMKPETVDAYRAEILRLRQVYGGQLEILLGLEHDALGSPIDRDYDYCIESVHAIRKDGMLYYIDWTPEKLDDAIRAFGDPYACAKAYFETCAAAYAHTPAIIAGHLDLLTKFNEQHPRFDEENPRFLGPALEALDCALDHGLVPELNTGGIARNYRTTPYPGTAILRRLQERNAPIVVTSDCHDAGQLACWYPNAAQLLRELGFRFTLRLRKSGWEEIPL